LYNTVFGNGALLNIKLFSGKILKLEVAYLKQYLTCSCMYECTFLAMLNDDVLLLIIQIMVMAVNLQKTFLHCERRDGWKSGKVL